MNKNKKVLICINNAYSCIDGIYSELYKIKNYGFNIKVLFIKNNYNLIALNKLKDLHSINIIDTIFIVTESTNIFRFLYNKIIISAKFKDYASYILIGGSITPEEIILCNTIDFKKSILYGVLPTTPPVLMNQNVIRTLKNESINKNKIIQFDKVSEYVYTEKKELYFIKKISYKIINAFFYRYKKYNKQFFRVCFNYLLKKNNNFNIDDTAKINQYANKNFVKAHFTPNAYWSFILKLNYPNEIVFQYSNINSNQDSYRVEKSNITLFHKRTSLFIFGPSSNLAFKYIIKAIKDLSLNNNIILIKLRPHPRYKKCTDELFVEIKKNFPLICTNILMLEETIQFQSNKIDFVLAPLTSALNSISNPNETIILLHKEWAILEFGVDKIDHLTGWALGYNTNWLEINYNGEINQFSENIATSIEHFDTFGNVLINELNNNILYE